MPCRGRQKSKWQHEVETSLPIRSKTLCAKARRLSERGFRVLRRKSSYGISPLPSSSKCWERHDTPNSQEGDGVPFDARLECSKRFFTHVRGVQKVHERDNSHGHVVAFFPRQDMHGRKHLPFSNTLMAHIPVLTKQLTKYNWFKQEARVKGEGDMSELYGPPSLVLHAFLLDGQRSDRNFRGACSPERYHHVFG